MKPELRPLSSSYTDDDQNNLKKLLETFGSVVSLEDIASAYCGTGRNLYSATEILCNMQGSVSGTSSKSQDVLETATRASSGSSSNNISEDAHIFKWKKNSASMGTVSDIIGKRYIRPRPQSNGSNEKLKPVKLYSDDFPVSEIWDEKKELASASQSEPMDNDLGDFLYNMLGNGFQLEKSVIQEVIGQCGYNMPKSINKLLDLSAATLEKSDDVIGIAAGNSTKNSLDLGSISCRKQSPLVDFSERPDTSINSGDELKLPTTYIKKKAIEREILEALFTVPGRNGEKQESSDPVRTNRSSPYGQIVSKPPEETIIEDFTFITITPVGERNDEANQNSYEELRKAVTENWVIMKEYYKASAVAFTRKDYENARKLLEEGNIYMRKAREADELSAKKLIEGSGEEEEISFNMHHLEPKYALRHMKLHLTSFSGLPSVPYHKFVVGTNGGDKKDGQRKRLITRLLEKERIPWTEEGNGWIISIRMDEIDPTTLKFCT